MVSPKKHSAVTRSFASSLRELRKNRKATLQEMSVRAKVSRSMISKIERNEVQPSLNLAVRLAYDAARNVALRRVCSRNKADQEGAGGHPQLRSRLGATHTLPLFSRCDGGGLPPGPGPEGQARILSATSKRIGGTYHRHYGQTARQTRRQDRIVGRG